MPIVSSVRMTGCALRWRGNKAVITGTRIHRRTRGEPKNSVRVSTDPNALVRDYLANERTFLAYLRTALALISLGITINRFSLYLLDRNLVSPTPGTGLMLRNTENFGTGMAIIGLVVLAWGAIHFTITYRQIATQVYRPSLISLLVLAAVILIAAVTGVLWLFLRP